jgi:hypothetical protein
VFVWQEEARIVMSSVRPELRSQPARAISCILLPPVTVKYDKKGVQEGTGMYYATQKMRFYEAQYKEVKATKAYWDWRYYFSYSKPW